MPRGRKRGAQVPLDAHDAAAIAQSFQEKRIKTTTKRMYSSKVKIMSEWVQSQYPTALDADGECRLPLPKEVVLGFFGNLVKPAHECDTENVHADDATSAPLSASCVEGYRSALVNWYRASGLEFETTVDRELREILDGYVKSLNQLKQRGLMDITEGKRYLKWGGYDLLATKLMKLAPSSNGQTWGNTVFAWSFFVLQWNLMSRSDSVDKIMLEHVDWSEDALIVEEQGHKGDQTGADKYGKHVFANPYEPSKCPILALAVNIFSCPERLSGRHQLFIGSDSKGRFSRALRKVISSLNEDELRVLGCRTQDIGTHSLRKGSSTYALSHVSGPTPVSVFLRMGQSLGQLKDRYIFSGEGADQLCGRMISGLPFDCDKFSVLPPHFQPSLSHEFTVDYWNEIVAGYEQYPRSSQAMFPYLLASVVYHENFLREELSPQHPIFKSRVFINNRLLERLRVGVVLACGSSPVCSMKASGIPPHLAIASRVHAMEERFDGFESRLTAVVSAQASAIVTEIRQSFVIQGAVPVSMRDFESLRAELVGEIRSAVASVEQRDGAHAVPTEEAAQWKSWPWEDGLLEHPVPPDWEFPVKTRVKLMWDLWHYGDKNDQIRPYRLISKKIDIKPEHQMRYHRVQTVMDALETIARDDKLLPADTRRVSELSVALSDRVFDEAYTTLLRQLYEASKARRVEDLTCGTLYNKLCKYRKSNRVAL